MRVALIGYGYWGPNLARVISEAKDCALAWVIDNDHERLGVASLRHKGARLSMDPSDAMTDPHVSAVVIATPPSTHFRAALAAIDCGKDVLIEKPIATSGHDAHVLIAEAERGKRVLMVDHTFAYSPAVEKLADLVGSGEIGDVLLVESMRANLGLYQRDVDVVWDLAPHDLSILAQIVPEMPASVVATGTAHAGGTYVDSAHLSLAYASGIEARISVNWLSPVKVRRTLIVGSKKMVVYDDTETSEKIRVYDRGMSVTDAEGGRAARVAYRTGDMTAPHLDMAEPLASMFSEFAECVEARREPHTSGRDGAAIVAVLEAASKSIAAGGARMVVSA